MNSASELDACIREFDSGKFSIHIRTVCGGYSVRRDIVNNIRALVKQYFGGMDVYTLGNSSRSYIKVGIKYIYDDPRHLALAPLVK